MKDDFVNLRSSIFPTEAKLYCFRSLVVSIFLKEDDPARLEPKGGILHGIDPGAEDSLFLHIHGAGKHERKEEQ